MTTALTDNCGNQNNIVHLPNKQKWNGPSFCKHHTDTAQRKSEIRQKLAANRCQSPSEKHKVQPYGATWCSQAHDTSWFIAAAARQDSILRKRTTDSDTRGIWMPDFHIASALKLKDLKDKSCSCEFMIHKYILIQCDSKFIQQEDKNGITTESLAQLSSTPWWNILLKVTG